MFLFAEPNEEALAQFLESQKGNSFSYAEVGVSRNGSVPDGYRIDRTRAQIGRGHTAFERAIEAVRCWKMFDLTWMKVYPGDTPLIAGATVAVLIKHFGFWSLNAAQIGRAEKSGGDFEQKSYL